jgi:hypothetical protein
MTWVATAIVSSAVIGGYSANKAAKEQARSVDRSTAAQERMFNRQVELQEPFRQAGVNALPALVAASEYNPFTLDKFQIDPGYGFRFKEGLRALENRAAARGNLLSGNQMRELVDFSQNLASQEYGNAFNRYQAEFASKLNPYQALAGVGQTSANTLTGAAGRLGENIGANMVAAGNARASGYMGTANAISNALGQGLNYYQNQQLMARMFPQQGGGAMNPAYPAGIYNPTDLA